MRPAFLIQVIFALTMTMTTFFDTIDARYFIECMPCIGQECDIMPSEFCMYGEYRDICGRRHCAKGPGERCGGPRGILGECGEGLMCKDEERCGGCSSVTMECHQ